MVKWLERSNLIYFARGVYLHYVSGLAGDVAPPLRRVLKDASSKRCLKTRRPSGLKRRATRNGHNKRMSQLFMSLDWKHTYQMLQFRCRSTGYTDIQFVIPLVNLFSLLYKYYVHAWASIARPPLHNYIIVRNSHSSCFHLGNIVWNEFPPCFFTKIDLQVLRIAYSMQDKEAPQFTGEVQEINKQ